MIRRAVRFVLNALFWIGLWAVVAALVILALGLALGAFNPKSGVIPAAVSVVGGPDPIGLLGVPEAAGAGQPATAKPLLAIIPVRRLPAVPDPRREAMPATMSAPALAASSNHAAASADIRFGTASTYGSGYSEWWVALPQGPGWRFRVCPFGHPGKCRTLTSTDAGPDRAMQRQGRIVDLPVGAFGDVCGGNWRILGLCKVVVQVLGRTR